MRPMSSSEVVRHWRDRLSAALDDPAEGIPVPRLGDLPAPPVLDRLALHHAAAVCPAGVMPPDPQRFDEDGRLVEATFTMIREVALVALRNAMPGSDAVTIVDAAMSQPDMLRQGVADWIRGADRAAVATLRNAAVSWVVDARAVGARHGEPQWCPPTPLVYPVGDRGVKISAAADALRRTASGVHLLVMRSRCGLTDRRVAGRVALLWAVVKGTVASSVVLGMRASHARLSFEVDDDLLEDSIADAVNDLRWAQQPSLAPIVPGSDCRYCRLLPVCVEGAAHVEATRRYPFPPGSCGDAAPSA